MTLASESCIGQSISKISNTGEQNTGRDSKACASHYGLESYLVLREMCKEILLWSYFQSSFSNSTLSSIKLVV